MSDKNRKDSETSLPDMREMFEHYTSVEDDEKPAEQNEMEKIAHKYLDGGDAQTEDETRHESAAAPEEERQEPVGVSDPGDGEIADISEPDDKPSAEPKPDNVYKFIPPDDLSGEDIPKVTEPEYPTHQAFDDFDLPSTSASASAALCANMSARSAKTRKTAARERASRRL